MQSASIVDDDADCSSSSSECSGMSTAHSNDAAMSPTTASDSSMMAGGMVAAKTEPNANASNQTPKPKKLPKANISHEIAAMCVP